MAWHLLHVAICLVLFLASQIGFIESKEQAERKSGAEAWSLRVQERLAELSYEDFIQRFSEDKIPFHRIAFFKQQGVIVW